MARDDFSERTKQTLSIRVAHRCSNPTCRRITAGPNTDPSKTTNIGVAAHITAASSGGPRYDTNLSNEKRSSIENGLWLCQSCSKLIDSDVQRYPAELLQSWKEYAEAAVQSEIDRTDVPRSEIDHFLRLFRKMPALFQEMATDLRNNESLLIRDFVALSSRGTTFNHTRPRFQYFVEDHPNLLNAVSMLAEGGFIRETKFVNHPIYRMTEEFVDLLLALRP